MSEKSKSRNMRILLVEDSPVVSLRTEDSLTDHGYFVVGPAYDMTQAMDLAAREQIDAAVVDLNIRGEKSFPVLGVLNERDIPFVITSGYANWSMPEEWQDSPRLQKPFEEKKLLDLLDDLIPDEQTEA